MLKVHKYNYVSRKYSDTVVTSYEKRVWQQLQNMCFYTNAALCWANLQTPL